uniref:Uncharacterized protein n=1 Tax=Triticum urartu TaxID=4572 RepID=A0A8R7RB32_TRIUA
MLDTRMMEFSIVDLPPGKWSKEGVAIVEAGEGRLGMFGFHGKTASELSYTFASNKGKSLSQWQMEKTISLDSSYKYCIRGATGRYLLLMRTETLANSYMENTLYEYLSLDVKKLQLPKVCLKQQKPFLLFETHIYTNFPPSLLP